jgi:hypothetical protein
MLPLCDKRFIVPSAFVTILPLRIVDTSGQHPDGVNASPFRFGDEICSDAELEANAGITEFVAIRTITDKIIAGMIKFALIIVLSCLSVFHSVENRFYNNK